MKFVKESVFPVPLEKLWAFHERPDVFALLTPSWQKIKVIQPPTSLKIGTRVLAKVKMGPLPFWKKMVAEHVEYEEGHMFADTMREGPFRYWLHRHVMTQGKTPGESVLRDDIEYELPLGALGNAFGGWFARRELERLFDYRHRVTRDFLAA